MPSSDITIFSDVAKDVDGAKKFSKFTSQHLMSQKGIATVAAASGTGTDIGMIPFQEGWSLIGFSIVSDDLDTGTDVTLDVGYLYDDSNLTDDPNAFLSAADIAQDGGSLIWPIADGLLTGVGFTSEGSGFLTITTGGGATTTAGDITLTATFTYDN